VEVSTEPRYGGYAIARIGGRDVAGIGPAQAPDAPTAWMLYIGSDDLAALAEKVRAAGGTVVAPPFEVADQGSMAVFQDAAGAFISAWQSNVMSGFGAGGDGAFAWAELNARGIERAAAFYGSVFGWTSRSSEMPGGLIYHEFRLGEESLAGGMEMNPAVPPMVPSYWMPYFGAADVDADFARAKELGAAEMVSPQDFPGGRFAIVSDPQGATFGLLRMAGQ
jgi:hypothetical protein